MEKNIYVKPQIEVVILGTADVVTGSPETTGGDEP